MNYTLLWATAHQHGCPSLVKEAVLRTAGSHRMGSTPIPCISLYEGVPHLGIRSTTGLKIFSYSYVGLKDLRNRFSLEVEHEAFNLRVVGSIPTIGSCLAKKYAKANASPFSSDGRASLL